VTAQIITVTASTVATQVVEATGQNQLIANLDLSNVVYLSDQNQFTPGDSSQCIALAANSNIVFDGSEAYFALVTGSPVSVAVVPGATSFFQAINRLIVQGADSGVLVYNGTPALNTLAEAMAGASYDDSYGNPVLEGITSWQIPYSIGALILNINGGQLFISDGDPIHPSAVLGYADIPAPVGDLTTVGSFTAQALDGLSSSGGAESWNDVPLAATWSAGGHWPLQVRMKASPPNTVQIYGDITTTTAITASPATIGTISNSYYIPLTEIINIDCIRLSGTLSDTDDPFAQINTLGQVQVFNCKGATRLVISGEYSLDMNTS
jgi:hypothetical protein